MTPEIKQRIEQIRRGEVPEGYKRTKAGIIPLDWEIHDLSQHLSESRIPGSNGAVAKKLTVKLWNKGVYEKREIHEGSESTTYYKRKAGQFIYSKLDFLNCAFGIIPNALDGYESTQDLPCFDICGVNSHYLLTYVTQKNFYTHFGMIADGGRKARRVGPSDMLSFPLIYPSLNEQKRIAEILSVQDKIIALKEKLLEEKKRQKKALMQQLLTGKKRLPGFSDKWLFVRANQIFKNVTDKTHDGTLEVLSATQDKGIVPRSQIDIDIKYAEESLTGYKKVMKGNFVISLRSFQGGIEYSKYTGIVSPAYTVLTSMCPIEDSYFKQFFKSVDYINRLNVAVYGIRDGKQISYEDFGRIKIPYPPIDEQKAIATVLEKADQEIDLLLRSLDQEKQKKKALMQLLLTGIVRVN